MATKDEIWSAAQALADAGERPTLAAVRKVVGANVARKAPDLPYSARKGPWPWKSTADRQKPILGHFSMPFRH